MEMCVCECIWGGGLEKNEGELSVMPSVSGAGCDKRGSGWYLSFSLTPTYTHYVREKGPVVFPSTAHEWTQRRCAGVRQPFVDCILGQRDERGNTDGETLGGGSVEKRGSHIAAAG